MSGDNYVNNCFSDEKNREAERSNRVCALMEGRYREQVPTASSTTEGLSKKQTPLGKPGERLTWTQLYGK